MKPSKKCIDLICHFEGFFSKSYRCPANVWTIGWGTIRYKNGKKVQPGETITKAEAEIELMDEVEKIAKKITANVNQSQFDALVSFTYNCGFGNLSSSTLYRKVRQNPNDPTIRNEFMKWNKARVNGVLTPLKGLTRRRIAEADLYFS